MGRGRKRGGPSPKTVPVSLIESGSERKHPVYKMIDELIAAHHPHLAGAKIAAAWRYRWKPNIDGQLKLGATKKGSDLDRELHAFDFVLLINHEAWNSASQLTLEQQQFLLDELLTRCARAKDRDGNDKIDERGRPVWRLRRPDVETFHECVMRHGLVAVDVKRLVMASQKFVAAEQPLLADLEPAGEGEPAVVDPSFTVVEKHDPQTNGIATPKATAKKAAAKRGGKKAAGRRAAVGAR